MFASCCLGMRAERETNTDGKGLTKGAVLEFEILASVSFTLMLTACATY